MIANNLHLINICGPTLIISQQSSTWATHVTLQLYIIKQLYELNICYLHQVTSLNNLVHLSYQYRIKAIFITYFVTRPINGHMYQYNQ